VSAADETHYTREQILAVAHALLTQAIEAGATEVSIEPAAQEVSVDYRIEGEWRRIRTLPGDLHENLVNRYKIMAQFRKTWDHQAPQAGVIRVQYRGIDHDFWVATEPTPAGERIQMRVLN